MSEKRALIVDDEPDIRELLGITLGRMGVQVSPAATIAEALDLLREQNFDLCLTDMRLPDGNGLDLVADITRRHPGMPVAVITAHGNMESAITALKSGAFDFVTKPVDLKDLRNLITQALKLRGQPAAPSRATSARDADSPTCTATISNRSRSAPST